MSFYDTDKVTINYYTVNTETGIKTERRTTRTNVPCRVETYDRPILSDKGKEENVKYLLIIDDDYLQEGDGIIVTSVMGRSITRKEYDIKKMFFSGGHNFELLECYLG